MTKEEFIKQFTEKHGIKKICNCCGKDRFFPEDYYVCVSPTTKTGWFVRKTCNRCYNKKRNEKKPFKLVKVTNPEPVQNPVAMRRAKEIYNNIMGVRR